MMTSTGTTTNSARSKGLKEHKRKQTGKEKVSKNKAENEDRGKRKKKMQNDYDGGKKEEESSG